MEGRERGTRTERNKGSEVKRGRRRKRKVIQIGLSQWTVSRHRHQSWFCCLTLRIHFLSSLFSASLHLILFHPHLILHLRDSAANVSAVLILFSALSCRTCPSYPDLYLHCNSKLTSLLLSTKTYTVCLYSETKCNILYLISQYVMSNRTLLLVYIVFILANYPSLTT